MQQRLPKPTNVLPLKRSIRGKVPLGQVRTTANQQNAFEFYNARAKLGPCLELPHGGYGILDNLINHVRFPVGLLKLARGDPNSWVGRDRLSCLNDGTGVNEPITSHHLLTGKNNRYYKIY